MSHRRNTQRIGPLKGSISPFIFALVSKWTLVQHFTTSVSFTYIDFSIVFLILIIYIKSIKTNTEKDRDEVAIEHPLLDIPLCGIYGFHQSIPTSAYMKLLHTGLSEDRVTIFFLPGAIWAIENSRKVSGFLWGKWKKRYNSGPLKALSPWLDLMTLWVPIETKTVQMYRACCPYSLVKPSLHQLSTW